MKLETLLALLACVSLAATRTIWDPTDMLILRASDNDVLIWACTGTNFVRAMRQQDEAVGMLLGDTRNPPSAASHWLQLSHPTRILSRWLWLQQDVSSLDVMDPKFGWVDYFQHEKFRVNLLRWHKFHHGDPTSATPIGNQVYKAFKLESFYRKLDRHATGANIEFACTTEWGGGDTVFISSLLPTDIAAVRNWPQGLLTPEGKPQKVQLPAIHALSDLIWVRCNGARRFVFSSITHDKIVAIIARVLFDRNLLDLEPWPAANSVVLLNTPEGRALLDSSVMQMVAYFLMTHKPQIGRQQIISYTFFRGPQQPNGDYLPNVAVQVGPVPRRDADDNIPPRPNPYPDPVFPFKRSVPIDTVDQVEKVGQYSRRNLVHEHIAYV